MMRIMARRMKAMTERMCRSKSRANLSCEDAFDDLAFRQHLEAWHVVALDDYWRQAPVFATVAAIFGP